MARKAGTDRMAMDIRAELKKAATKGGRYFTGTARMFLDSTTEAVSNTMPTVGAMLDINKDLINDTLRFIRNPVDALNRGIDRISKDEGIQALRKFGADAWDDLKTGNIYDPDRDRSGFGSGIDSLLDNFGDTDMSGFDENGDFDDNFDDSSFGDIDEKMLESHEQADDTRTVATIDAVQSTGSAIIANAKADAQTDIRLGIKQHAQLMGGMSNIVTQQGVLLESVNAMASSLVELHREMHNDTMAKLQTITDTLLAIKEQTGPPPKAEANKLENDMPFGINGELDIRKWLSLAKKNADNKYGISSALSMATMGMSPKQLIELVADNPWKFASDMIVSKVMPEYLKNTMETTQKYMESFFPSLLAKLADRGKRFDKDSSEGGGKLIDAIAGIFGVQAQKGGSLDLRPQDIMKKAEFTNRTATAIEKVIPMWLSKIYSALSGDTLSMYNYSKGEMESVTKVVSDSIHDSNDLVGRMGSAARTFYNRATDEKAVEFVDPEMRKRWENYLYRFMQQTAENGSFLDPNKSKADFMDMMPDDTDKELWYKMITATLHNMPRTDRLALNAEINKARFGQRQADERIANDLRDSNMDIAHAMVTGDLRDRIENSTVLYRSGLNDEQLKDITRKNQDEMIARGTGLRATNVYLADITSMLKRGIITYTTIVDDNRGNGSNPTDPISETYRQIKEAATDETDRLTRKAADEEAIKNDERERRQRAIRDNTGKQITDRANHKVWIRSARDVDQADLELAQGALVISRTEDGMSDAKKTEEQRMRESREKKMRGIAEGQVKRIKDAFHISDDDKFTQRVGKILESPFKLVDLGLRTVDQFLFKIIYGEDAPVDLDPDDPENDHKAKSLMNLITHNIKASWASTKEWFKEYIGDPIKEFFLGEQGLLGKVKSRLVDKVVDPAMDKVGKFKDNIKSKVLGTQEIVTKYIDDPDHPGEKKLVTEKGDYSGGILSNAMNKVRGRKNEIVGDVKSRGLSFLDTLLFDSAEGKRTKGRSYVAEDIDLDENGNQVITEGHFEYHGAVGAAREVVDKAKSTMMQWLFGQDSEGNDYDSTKKFEAVRDEVKKAFPDMTIGAGVGLIGSFFLPGGPILGSILGATGGLVAGSDRLKDYLFGESEDDHETTKYNFKTGKIETVKGKGRKGRIVPAEMQDAFKKFAPKMAIGAGLGVMGSMFLPGGPVIGAILGSIGGMTAASDKLKQIIFGDGTDEDNGIISPKMRKNIVDAFKKNAPGTIAGGVAGAKLGSMLGAGLGLIPGLSLLPTGPIFTLMGGITGAIGGNTLQEFFFGQEKEVEVTDPETGEVKKEKKRVGGLFGKAYDYVQEHMFKPFGEKLTVITGKVQEWFNSDVVGPLAHVTQPLKDAMEKTKNDIQDAFRHMGQHIKDSLDRTFENAFGKKMGEFFEEKIKKPLSNMASKILGGIGKAIGGILSAPFKLLDFIVTGNTKKLNEKGEIVDDELNVVEKVKKAAKPKTKKEKAPKEKKPRVGVLQGLRNVFSKKTDTTDDIETSDIPTDQVPKDITSTVGDVMDQHTPPETKAAEEAEKKTKRKGFFARIFGKDDKSTTPATEKVKETNETKTKPPEPKDAKSTKETKVKEPKDKTKSQKDEKADSTELKSDPSPKAEGTSASDSKDVKSAGRKGKSATDYLRRIDRTLDKIYKEIKGELGGVGYNINYIKIQFDKHLGKLKSDELDENMEGSTKKVRKRRGIIGKVVDGVTGFAGGVRDRVVDAKDAVVEKVKDVIGVVVKPFTMLGRAVSSTAKALTTFGRGLLSVLGTVAKGFAEGVASLFKGAGELLGKTLGGVGRMIWHAGKGIGQALGNTLSLVSSVVKSFGSAVAAGIAGVAKVAATVVPDIAVGIWKGVTGAAGALFKGAKWVGGKTVDAAKWAFGKITGKGKKEKAENKANVKISEAIQGGYMTMGIGKKTDVHPYPWVTYVKNKLTKSLNNYAIPVWIMGGKVGFDTDKKDDEEKEKFDNPKEQTDETKTTGNPQNLKGDPMPGAPKPPPPPGSKEQQDLDDAPPDQSSAAKGKTKKSKTNQRKKSKAKTEPPSPASKVGDNLPNNREEDEGGPNLKRIESVNQVENDKKRKEKEKFSIWKRGYKKVDTKAEKSKSPGDVYDAAIDRASTMEEAQGIMAAESMNDGALSQMFAKQATGDKEESGGLLDMLGNFFGGEGGLGGILKSAFTSMAPTWLLKGLSGAKSVGSAMGSTVMNNIPFIAGTAMAMKNGETDRVVSNVAKQVTGKGMKWLGKSATEAALSTVEGTAAKGLGAKAIKGFSALLAKFLANKTVQKAIAKISPKMYEKVAGKGANELVAEFTKRVAMSVGSEAVQKLASKLNLIVTVAAAVYDFVTGMGNVGQYFEVSDADATLGMKLTAGLCKAISGFCFGLIPVGWLANTIYGWFAGEEGRAELAEKQKSMEAKVAQYNLDNNTNMTVSEYAAQFDDNGNKRGFINTMKRGFASAGTAISNAWGGLTNAVSNGTSWLGEKASNFGHSVAETVGNGVHAMGDFFSNGAKTIGGAIQTGAGKVGEFFGGLGDNIYNFTTETAPEAIGYALKRTQLFFTNDIPNAVNSVGDFFTKTVPEWTGNAVQSVQSFWNDSVVPGWNNFWGGVGDFFTKSVPGFFTETIPEWTNNLKQNVSDFWNNTIVTGWNDLWGGVGNFFTQTLPEWGSNLKEGWNNFWGGVGDKISSTFNSAKEWVNDTAENVVQWGKDKIDGAKQWVGDKVEGVKDWANEKVEGVKSWAGDVKDWWGNAFNKVGESFSKGSEKAQSDYDSKSGKGPGLIGTVKSYVGSAVSTARDTISEKGLVSGVAEIGKGIGSQLLTYLEAIYKKPSKIIDIFSKVGEGVGGMIFGEDVSLNPTDVIGTLKNALTHAFTGQDPETGKVTPNANTGSANNGGILGWLRDTGSSIKGWVSNKISSWFNKGDDESGKGRWGTGVKPMSQTDSKWNSGSNEMAKVGCGPTAAAMVASAYGAKSTPLEADKLSKDQGMRASDGGTNPKFFGNYAKSKGFGMSEGPTNTSSITSSVSKGKPVVLMGKGGAYGKNMHYMVADRVSGNGNIGVVDPIGGARKTVDASDLTKHTSKTVYSYGKGEGFELDKMSDPNLKGEFGTGVTKVGREGTFGGNKASSGGLSSSGGNTTGGAGVPNIATAVQDAQSAAVGQFVSDAVNKQKKEEQIEAGRQAVLSQMKWLSNNPIPYSLSGPQDPDQGSASCASTVGWAYRKAFGVNGMSASSTTQSTDNRFTTIWENTGKPLDPSILQPGDVMYMNWNQTSNTGAMKHTEMYAGDNKDLSHGGPGSGPVYKDLNNYRRQHTMMVRRYNPLLTGDEINIVNSRGGTFGSSNVGSGGFGSYGSSVSRDSEGNLKVSLDSSGNISFLSNLTDFFGNVAGKLSSALGTIMGIKEDDSEDASGSSGGASSGGTSADFVPVAGGKVSGTDVTSKVYNYLRSMGLSKEATAGIMGNLDAESGIDPGNVQNGTYDKSLSKAEEDRKYIEDVTAGRHDFIKDSKGYGLAQWTYHSRKKGLWDLIQQQNAKLDDLMPQLQHLWNELNSYNLTAPLNKAKSVKEASDLILHSYEAPADQSSDVEDYRESLSQKWYDAYAKTETPDPEVSDEKAAQQDETAEEAGKGWGAGPGGISLGLESLNSTVANLNKFLEDSNSKATSEHTVSAITRQLTNSMSGISGGNEALMQAMVTSMAKMVELLTTIADNTKAGGSKDPTTGGRTSPKDKPRITQYPSASPMNENGTVQPTAIGAEIVDKMTANRR